MATHYITPETYADADMLAFVRQAIVEINACGQSYAVPGGRQWSAANLGELGRLETKFQDRVSASQNGRVINYVRFAR